ncbi:hypothetical protein SA496_15510 [Pseudomonas sp. JS3066]|uniref:hypothetical protein n=1 Tax=Pseudomonas sp. JS3066 TaxID=3090665 RepID=UPI002E7BBEB2|nr:hypothetical protein [Pseudomonas sp. JS3066]WVK91135.1 hypothetical protein SA496_15510 [Pseudomonas sp. JS3066]
MALGTLTIDLSANTARLESDLGKANRIAEQQLSKMEKIGSQIGNAIGTAVGALASGAFAAWIKTSIDIADNANDMAMAIGISVESFTALQYAAEHEGIAMEALSGTMAKFSKNIAAAAAGSKKQAQAFADIGVSVTDAGGKLKATDTLLLEVADRMAQYEDGANKAAVAQDLFGKSGTALLPLLNQGSDGIRQLTDDARQLGLVFDQDAADKAGQFNDTLFALQGASRGIANQISQGLLPSLNDLSGLMLDLAKDTDTANTAADVISGTLKGLATVGIVISASFKTTGAAIGAVASALTSAAQGDFKGAWATIQAGSEDYLNSTEAAIERIKKLWSGDYRQAGEGAAATAGIVRQALERSSQAAEDQAKATQASTDAINSQIQSLQLQAATLGMSKQEATLYKLALDGATDAQLASAAAALEQVQAYERNEQQLQRQTEAAKEAQRVLESLWTEPQKALAEYQQKTEALLKGGVSGAQLEEAMGRLDEELNTKLDNVGKKSGDTTDEISEAWKSAAQNIQSSMADTFMNIETTTFEGFLNSWGNLIQRMAAEAAAAQLTNALFGSAAGGEGDGWIKQGIAAVAGWFGGSGSASASLSAGASQAGYSMDLSNFVAGRAVGGPVMRGRLYEVGENNVPEVFRANGRQYMIPGNSGSVIPGGSNQTVNASFYYPNVTTEREARQSRIATLRDLNRLVVGSGRAA